MDTHTFDTHTHSQEFSGDCHVFSVGWNSDDHPSDKAVLDPTGSLSRAINK